METSNSTQQPNGSSHAPVALALFRDATEIVWKVADALYESGTGGAPPVRHFVRDADEAHRFALDGTFPVVGMSLDDVLDCACGGHANAREITSFYGVHRGFLSLVAQQEASDVEDLRGCSIAVDTYSGYASALFEILAKSGFDYKHDVSVILAGATNRRYEKLMAGEFTATLLGSPFDVLAESQKCRALARVLSALGGYQGVVFAAQRSWLNQNLATARHLTAVFSRALAWAQEAANRRSLTAIVRASQPPATDEASIDRIVERLFGTDSDYCPDGSIARSDARVVFSLFEKYRGVDLSYLSFEDLVDTRLAPLC